MSLVLCLRQSAKFYLCCALITYYQHITITHRFLKMLNMHPYMILQTVLATSPVPLLQQNTKALFNQARQLLGIVTKSIF